MKHTPYETHSFTAAVANESSKGKSVIKDYALHADFHTFSIIKPETLNRQTIVHSFFFLSFNKDVQKFPLTNIFLLLTLKH